MSAFVEVAAVMGGVSALFLCFALVQVAARRMLTARLDTFVKRHAYTPAPTIRRQSEEPQAAIIQRMNRRLRRASLARQLQAQLVRAGIDMPASRFLVAQFGLTIVFVSTAYYLTVRTGAGLFETVAAVALAVLVGWFLPRFVLKFLENRRLGKFEKQLPPTIDAMAGALQAGSSLTQAMEMVSREVPAPVGEEFTVVVREMAVGIPMSEAFDNVLDRVHSLDFDMLLSAIVIQHRVGGNLSSVLRTIAHTIRERLRIRGEISVLTAQARISAYVVSMLPVGVVGVLFFVAPLYISKLFLPGMTRYMLIGGTLGIIAGFFTMRKIAAIDV